VLFTAIAVIAAVNQGCGTANPEAKRYVEAVRCFADTVLKHGRDVYGKEKTPLFVDGLHAETLAPVRWECRGETWVLSNFASQQPLVRLLDGLTGITGEKKYRNAAEAAAGYALEHLQTPSGLLCWGGHTAWDLAGEKGVSQYDYVHEFKSHQPYYSLMWKMDASSTRRLMEMVWAGHLVDWTVLDYNRHADTQKKIRARWDSAFDEDIEVPFATEGNNLSFCNVSPSLIHSGVMLAVLDKSNDALVWTRRLVYRWQEGRDVKTGLCGGQLSYRKNDRAQDALGHVHPNINEAKIVGCYHQSSRYHHLPLAQMQAGEKLIAAGGKFAEAGREFIHWACEDLEVYGRNCYDDEKGLFVAKMTDGTVIKWQSTRKGYYIPKSFAPLKPDGFVIWGYAMAYRLTGNEAHRQMLRRLFAQVGLGDLGSADGEKRALCFDTDNSDWRMIYVLLELYSATKDEAMLRLACRVGDNLLKRQTKSGLFPLAGREYARTGDEIPLALLHLAGALDGKSSSLPAAVFDGRFFHCEYHGELEEHQKKRNDKRTYDHYVFYGRE
jgi:hypothetical protein